MTLQLNRRDDNKIPATIYVDNYGYTINRHQLTKDQLDAKRNDENPQYPHLSWSNERASTKHWPSRSEVPNYCTNSDANKYSNSDDNKVISKRSSSFLSAATTTTKRASAFDSRLHQHIKLPSVEEKIIRKIQDREDQRRVASIMDNIEEMKARFNADKDVQLSSSLKCSIRGKTASQITQALLAESEKNIRQSKNHEEIRINRTRQSRGISESRIVKRTTRIEFIDDRMLDQLDQSMSSSLYDVKKQLQNFNQRSEDLYHNSRWRKSYFK